MFLIETNEEKVHEHEITALIEKYHGKIDADRIRSVYQEAQTHYLNARVRKFVPIAVSCDVKEILAQIIAKENTAP